MFLPGMDARELKQYERFKCEAQSLRDQNHHLDLELRALRPQAYRAEQTIDRLRQSNAKLEAENLSLRAI